MKTGKSVGSVTHKHWDPCIVQADKLSQEGLMEG